LHPLNIYILVYKRKFFHLLLSFGMAGLAVNSAKFSCDAFPAPEHLAPAGAKKAEKNGDLFSQCLKRYNQSTRFHRVHPSNPHKQIPHLDAMRQRRIEQRWHCNTDKERRLPLSDAA